MLLQCCFPLKFGVCAWWIEYVSVVVVWFIWRFRILKLKEEGFFSGKVVSGEMRGGVVSIGVAAF